MFCLNLCIRKVVLPYHESFSVLSTNLKIGVAHWLLEEPAKRIQFPLVSYHSSWKSNQNSIFYWWSVRCILLSMPCFASLRPRLGTASSWLLRMRSFQCLHSLLNVQTFDIPSVVFSTYKETVKGIYKGSGNSKMESTI